MSIVGQKAVNKVRDYLTCNCITTGGILDNDKTVSWDGEIMLFNRESKKQKKSELVGLIRVQVKGETVKQLKESTSFSIEVADLRNYYKDGGILLFVCEFRDEKYQIHYRFLDLSDLEEIIDSIPISQQTVTIKQLNRVPTDTINMYDECIDFMEKRKELQKRPDYKNLTIESAVALGYTLNIKTPINTEFPTKEIVYATVNKEGSPINIPIGKRTIHKVKTIRTEQNSPVVNCGDITYNQYTRTIINDKGHLEIRIGDIIFTTNDGEVRLLFKPCFLNQAIKDVDFLQEVARGKPIKFLDLTKLILPPDKEMMDSVAVSQKFFADIKRLLALLDYYDDINLTDLEDYDCMALERIIGVAFYGLGFKIDNHGSDLPRISTFQIRKHKFMFIATVKDSMIIKINSVFDDSVPPVEFTLRETGEKLNLRIPLAPVIHELLDTVNWNYERFDKFIASLSHTKINDIYANFLMLKLIKEFDKTNDIHYLELAKIMLKYAPCNEIKVINDLQMKKRIIGSLTEKDEQVLEDILEKATTPEMKFGCYVLLDSPREAKKALQIMNDDAKDAVASWPIYNLYKRTGS